MKYEKSRFSPLFFPLFRARAFHARVSMSDAQRHYFCTRCARAYRSCALYARRFSQSTAPKPTDAALRVALFSCKALCPGISRRWRRRVVRLEFQSEFNAILCTRRGSCKEVGVAAATLNRSHLRAKRAPFPSWAKVHSVRSRR